MLRLAGKIEALLFSASSPVSEKELKSALNVSTAEIKDALEELRILLEDEAHGIFLKQLAGNWTLETKPELGDLVGNFRNTSKIKRFSLSRAVMEVLTIIAYKQPISRREVEEIRGVDSSKFQDELKIVRLFTLRQKNFLRYSGLTRSIICRQLMRLMMSTKLMKSTMMFMMFMKLMMMRQVQISFMRYYGK